MGRTLAACMLSLATVCAPLAAAAQVIVSAEYADPTTRYAHGVLGDAVEWGNMIVETRTEKGDKGGLFHGGISLTYHLKLPEEMVYEDTAPRLADVDGDGAPEIVVVESHRDFGARLAVYGIRDGRPTLRAWTEFIGTPNRWLAPVGVADFKSDGVIHIAVIDRPHLVRRLMVLPYNDGLLDRFQGLEPVTNHRIGDDYISGGIRDCGQGPEIIVLNAAWTRIVQVRWDDGKYRARDIAPYAGRESVEAALKCG